MPRCRWSSSTWSPPSCARAGCARLLAAARRAVRYPSCRDRPRRSTPFPPAGRTLRAPRGSGASIRDTAPDVRPRRWPVGRAGRRCAMAAPNARRTCAPRKTPPIPRRAHRAGRPPPRAGLPAMDRRALPPTRRTRPYRHGRKYAPYQGSNGVGWGGPPGPGVPSGDGRPRPALGSENQVLASPRQADEGVGRGPGGPAPPPLAHPGGFVFHDQRVVASLILIGTGDGHRLFAEFGGFQNFRLVQGHLAQLVVGHSKVEKRRTHHSGLTLDQRQRGTQILIGRNVETFFGRNEAGNIIAVRQRRAAFALPVRRGHTFRLRVFVERGSESVGVGEGTVGTLGGHLRVGHVHQQVFIFGEVRQALLGDGWNLRRK